MGALVATQVPTHEGEEAFRTMRNGVRVAAARAEALAYPTVEPQGTISQKPASGRGGKGPFRGAACAELLVRRTS
jgi:hypothetical protein